MSSTQSLRHGIVNHVTISITTHASRNDPKIRLGRPSLVPHARTNLRNPGPELQLVGVAELPTISPQRRTTTGAGFYATESIGVARKDARARAVRNAIQALVTR